MDLAGVVRDIFQPGHGLTVIAKDGAAVGHLCDIGQDMGVVPKASVRFALYTPTSVRSM